MCLNITRVFIAFLQNYPVFYVTNHFQTLRICRQIMSQTPESPSQPGAVDERSVSAFECLDQLLAKGKISGAKAAELRTSFNQLLETLSRSQATQKRMELEVTDSNSRLKKVRRELDLAVKSGEDQSAEVERMKQKRVEVYDHLKEAEEKEYNLQLKINWLKREKISLEEEHQNQPKQAAKQYLALQGVCEGLTSDVNQLKEQSSTLSERLDSQQNQTREEQSELAKIQDLAKINQAELARLILIPPQIREEIEKVSEKKSNVEYLIEELKEQYVQHEEDQKEMEAKCKELTKAKNKRLQELHKLQNQQLLEENRQDRLLEEQQRKKEKDDILLEERNRLEINIEQILTNCMFLHEKMDQDTRIKDKLLPEVKRIELQLTLAQDDLAHTQKLHSDIKAQKEAMPDGDCLLQRRKDLEKEVENLKHSLIASQALRDETIPLLEEYMRKEEAKKRETYLRRDDVRNLGCLVLVRADEKEQKCHELMKAKLKYSHTKQDLQQKVLTIQDHLKQIQETQSRLDVFAKLYEVTKAERNKYLNLIHISKQSREKMEKKLTDLEGGYKILHPNAIAKENQLQKSRWQLTQSQGQRDRLKNGVSKAFRTLQEWQRESEEQSYTNDDLIYNVDLQETCQLNLSKNHKSTTTERTNLNAQFTDRGNELSMFGKKLNEIETAIESTNNQLQNMENEMRRLTVNQKDQDRLINIQKTQLRCKQDLSETLNELQTQLCESQDWVEKTNLNWSIEKRTKVLSGEDLSPVELRSKVEQLEIQVMEKDIKILETELNDDQLTHLIEEIQTKAKDFKDELLCKALKVSELKFQIRNGSSKLKAVVAELSMRQAEAATLQQELKEKQLQVDVCQKHVEQGLPPSESIQQEWQRHLRDEHRRRLDAEKAAKLAVEDEWRQIADGVYSTATPRPNAYIPVDDPLPVPKHYGALAPFRPSEPSANMRHIRKPKQRTLEI